MAGYIIVTVLELVGGAPGGETPRVADGRAGIYLAYIDTLANPKIRFDSVKSMTKIQNTS